MNFLTQKLLNPMIKSERLGRSQFNLISIGTKGIKFDTTKLTILFHYSIMSDTDVTKINDCISKAKESGVEKISLLSYCTTPEMVSKITDHQNLPLYTLKKDLAISERELAISYDKAEIAHDFENCIKEQLAVFSY